MSRIGNQPVSLPSGVEVVVKGAEVHVKGPKGKLFEKIPERITVNISEGTVTCVRPDARQESRAFRGRARALVANGVRGVTAPFSTELEIRGVG